MNTNRQRIKIAEARGLNTKHVRAFVLGHGGYSWRHFDTQKDAYRWDKTFPSEGFKIEEYTNVNLLPDYLNDLNAMHEAKKVLKAPHVYNEQLEMVVLGYSLRDKDAVAEFMVRHATAAQRAEAFLRTLDLWESETVANSKTVQVRGVR